MKRRTFADVLRDIDSLNDDELDAAIDGGEFGPGGKYNIEPAPVTPRWWWPTVVGVLAAAVGALVWWLA